MYSGQFTLSCGVTASQYTVVSMHCVYCTAGIAEKKDWSWYSVDSTLCVQFLALLMKQ